MNPTPVPSIKFLDISLLKLSLFSSTGPSSVIVPFLQRMQRNETLLELNVKGYKLGDKLAIPIADMLRVNRTLIVLNSDDNRITLAGFQALEYAMHRNRTLQSFIYPTGDVRRILKHMTAPDKQHVLFTILSNIQLAAYFNQHNNGKHSYIQDSNYDAPKSGAILTYSDQAAPPTPAHAAVSTPVLDNSASYAVSGEYLVSQAAAPIPSLAPAHRPAPPPPPVASEWSSSASSISSVGSMHSSSGFSNPATSSFTAPSAYTSSSYTSPSTTTSYSSTSRNSTAFSNDYSSGYSTPSNDFSAPSFAQSDFSLNSSSTFAQPSTSTTGDARTDDLFSTLASVLAADSNSANNNNYSNTSYW